MMIQLIRWNFDMKNIQLLRVVPYKYKCEVNGFQSSQVFVFTAIYIVSFKFFSSFFFSFFRRYILKSVSNTESGEKPLHRSMWWENTHQCFQWNEKFIKCNHSFHFVCISPVAESFIRLRTEYWIYWQLKTIRMCMSPTQEHKTKVKECLDWWFNVIKYLGRGRSSAKCTSISFDNNPISNRCFDALALLWIWLIFHFKCYIRIRQIFGYRSTALFLSFLILIIIFLFLFSLSAVGNRSTKLRQ